MEQFSILDFRNCLIRPDKVSDEGIKKFQEHIWEYYSVYGRQFGWRTDITPYKILVSEIMLQQTQTERVKKKFAQWIEALPNFEALAAASQREVLGLWQGLGYNRRGLALHVIAQKVVSDYNGILPSDPKILVTFPGIGKATAASICAFAFDMPTIFIETNIRAVFIHLFFKDRTDVSDKELMPFIAQTIMRDNARHWYYALMDYGVMLKKSFGNPSRKSKHYIKQSRFEGSERQIRGMIIKYLTENESITFDKFCEIIDREPARIQRNLDSLVAENMIKKDDQFYII